MPSYFHLELQEQEKIKDYLVAKDLIAASSDVVGIDKAGEGNMNLVLRVTTQKGSFIIKQSRPWVEKYPQIAAPEGRLLVEAAFYEAAQSLPFVSSHMPDLLYVDRINRIAQFEDLGTASDFTSVYSNPSAIESHLPELCNWLSALHSGTFDEHSKQRLINKEMRTLNHEHIFHFPLLTDNGFDLDAITPGLQAKGDSLKQHIRFVDTVTELGKRYLNAGTNKKDVLLHGDYYPGSWLNTEEGIKIIDPEFGFFGDSEFDVGVFIAHMLIAGLPETVINTILDLYKGPHTFAPTLALQYAGVEIMRRLIGVAQLPLTANLETKASLIDQARRLVLTP
ncbi:MAG: phosphotransferase [Rhodothermaceae bacterium]|nr:phosphotransferase [Rhodothermaceae bacterium]